LMYYYFSFILRYKENVFLWNATGNNKILPKTEPNPKKSIFSSLFQ